MCDLPKNSTPVGIGHQREYLEKQNRVMQYQPCPDFLIARNKVKDVIFNPPATVVLWEDGSKTLVKVREGDVYDPEIGLAMAFSKRLLGDDFHAIFRTYLKKYDEKFENKMPKEGFSSTPVFLESFHHFFETYGGGASIPLNNPKEDK